MKKVKLSHLIIVNLVLGIIIFLNFSSFFVNKKKHIFNRAYKASILKPLNVCIKVSDSTFTPVFPSNAPNVFSRKKLNYKFTFFDMSMQKEKSKDFELRNNLFPVFILKDSIICTDEFAHLSVNNGEPLYKNLKVSAIKKVKNNFYVLGEYLKDKYYIYGFFKLNQFLDEITPIAIIQRDTSSKFAENALKYNGNFFGSIDTTEQITYITNKSSNVWLFEDYKLLSKINTLDKTPLPKIISKGEVLVYDRSNTFNTNMASFIYSNQIHIFSNRNTENKKITIDVYSLDGNYIYSYFLPDVINETQHITQVFSGENKIIIAFENNCFSLFTIE